MLLYFKYFVCYYIKLSFCYPSAYPCSESPFYNKFLPHPQILYVCLVSPINFPVFYISVRYKSFPQQFGNMFTYNGRQNEHFDLNVFLTPFYCITFSILKCNKLFVKEKLYYFCRICCYNIYLQVYTRKLLYFLAFARLLKRSHLVQATLFLQGGAHRAEGTRALSPFFSLSRSFLVIAVRKRERETVPFQRNSTCS